MFVEIEKGVLLPVNQIKKITNFDGHNATTEDRKSYEIFIWAFDGTITHKIFYIDPTIRDAHFEKLKLQLNTLGVSHNKRRMISPASERTFDINQVINIEVSSSWQNISEGSYHYITFHFQNGTKSTINYETNKDRRDAKYKQYCTLAGLQPDDILWEV